MAFCLNCGRRIPDWYVPPLCDKCLETSWERYFDGKDNFNSGTFDEDEPVGALIIVPKETLLALKNLALTHKDPPKEFSYYKELFETSPYTWIGHLQTMHEQSAFFFDGTISYTVKKYRKSKATPQMILQTLKDSKHYKATRWYDIRNN